MGIAKDPCNQNEFVHGLGVGSIHGYPCKQSFVTLFFASMLQQREH